MKKFLVTVELSKNNHVKTTKAIVIEAGNKRLAAIRALSALSASEGPDVYKIVKKIEEAK